MDRWACVFLAGTLTLASCATGSSNYGYGYQSSPGGQIGGNAALQRVAILLPLTGARSALGSTMLQAAQLALPGNGTPTLDVLDTGGTVPGAANAMNAALAHGDGLILGPLTAAETSQTAPAAQAAGTPVLAFTNDTTQARPGVWPLGLSPGQQVRRLVAAAQAQGRTQFAALLPDTDFGRAMATALQDALHAAGLPQAQIRMHASGMSAITAAIRDLSGYADRRGPIDAHIRRLKREGTADARKEIADLQKTPIPPPSFNALLLADIGDDLREIAAVLPYYDIDRNVVQVMGPYLWADRESGSGAVHGAWFAAPDPSSRASFVNDYQSRYGAEPPAIADLAFDGAYIARSVSSASEPPVAALTQPNGFVGADGLIILAPDGHVRRALAVFKVERSGPVMIEPPTEASATDGF